MELLHHFKYFIFDGDGTLFDSNHWKERNIFKATLKYTSEKVANEFTADFIARSGVSRQEKIFSYFDKGIGEKILQEYNKKNIQCLKDTKLVKGAADFVKSLRASHKKLILFSGGDLQEIEIILNNYKILSCFDNIVTGLDKKTDNLKKLVVSTDAVYFGDSLRDYEISSELGIPFVYIDGYIVDSMKLNNEALVNLKLKFRDFSNLRGTSC